ncbi:MAG: hypothetical protein ACPGQS_09410 [Bradymonadia bacterium]
MIQLRPLIRLTLIGGLYLAVFGCSPKYIKGTEVAYTAEKQSVADAVERYRIAVVNRDTDGLRALASSSYYENASTTVDPSDDYDRQGFEKVLSELKENVKAVKYEIDITDIQVTKDTARVDLEYRGQYLFVVAGQERWQTSADKNRLNLRKENGQWRILSGM